MCKSSFSYAKTVLKVAAVLHHILNFVMNSHLMRKVFPVGQYISKGQMSNLVKKSQTVAELFYNSKIFSIRYRGFDLELSP